MLRETCLPIVNEAAGQVLPARLLMRMRMRMRMRDVCV